MWTCRTNSCCPLFLGGTFMNRCTWCTVVHHHVLRFLFVRGLAIILTVGGLDLEDQQNGLIVISFVGLDLEHLMSRRYFCHCFSWLRQLSVCKILEPLFKSHHNGREWALKSCSNCRKIIFHHELQSLNVMCLLYNHFAKDLDLKALSLFSFVLRFLLQVSCWVELCSVFEECAFF